MGWESRKRGGRYYTRSRRVNGRVVREYVGGGELAELAAMIDAEERAQKQALAARSRRELERHAADDQLVAELCGAVDAVSRLVLLAAGYRQHHRGEWRHRRGQDQET